MKTMKKFFYLVILSAAFFSCGKDKVKGSGEITTEQRVVTDFSSVSVRGSSKVHITQGDSLQVQVKAYSNLLPYLLTVSQNGRLTISYSDDANIENDNSEIFITMPEITGLTTNGSAIIDATGTFLAVDEFNTAIYGSGSITMDSAATTYFNAVISGSGDLKCYPLMAKNAQIHISGSGNVETYVSQNLSATISGSGNVYYKGNPPVVTADISGSGKMIPQ